MENRYPIFCAVMIHVVGIILSPGTLSSQVIPWSDTNRRAVPVVLRSAIYDRESIWNYHVSDGDLYLEYGFRSLVVNDYRLADRIIREEVYDLSSPLNAYGLFTCNRMNGDFMDSIYQQDCVYSSGYRVASGHQYLVLKVLSGSDPGRDSMLYMAKQLLPARGPVDFLLPDPFEQPNFRRARNNLIYLRGQAGLRNSTFPWQELMLGLQYDMFAISLPVNGSDLLFARITFAESPLIMTFLERTGLTVNHIPVPNTNTEDGLYREFQQIDDNTIYFLESQEPFPIDVLVTPER